MRVSRSFLLLAGGFVLLTGSGCGPRNFTNDNDQLRRENLELTRQIETLETRLQDRLGQIETLHAQLNGGELPEGADRPIASALEIDSYSGPVDTNRDGYHDAIRLYLIPTDQHGRMIPVAGTLTAALVHLPDTGEPKMLHTERFTPDQLDDAYRDGFTGPYYRAEFDLAGITLTEPPTNELTVRVVLEPAGGGTLRDQRSYRVRLSGTERSSIVR